jgi:antitoxin component YwqK of YwqJK toxin-antitoxin module
MKGNASPATRLLATLAGFPAWAGVAVMLAACHSASPPQLTGSQGGLLPGMVAPETVRPKTAPQGYTGTTDQVLPDGHVLRRAVYNGMVISQTWLSSVGIPERQIFYQGGSAPAAEIEFGPDGQPVRQTTFFPGTDRPMRVDEYADGNRVIRFTEYWPNGQPRILSEADVSTPAGVVNRIQEWYENGRQKSLVQQAIERDTSGQAIGTTLQGRQTQWDQNGVVTADADYDHDVLKHDYLVEAKKYAPEP